MKNKFIFTVFAFVLSAMPATSVDSQEIKPNEVFVVLKDGNVREKPTMESKIVGKVRRHQIIENFQLTNSSKWISYKIPASGNIFEAIIQADKSTAYYNNFSLGEEIDDEVRTFYVFSGNDRLDPIIEAVKGYFLGYTGGSKSTQSDWVDEWHRVVAGPTKWYEIQYVPVTKIAFADRYIHKSLGVVCNNAFTAHEIVRKQQLIDSETRRLKKKKEAKLKREKAIRATSWPEHIKQTVIQRKITLGMTPEQVIASWGKPRDINRTVTMQGTREQWVYGSYGSSSKPTFLYFDNGTLTAWQD